MSSGYEAALAFSLGKSKGPDMKLVRAFCYDRQESYYAIAEREQAQRYERMRRCGGYCVGDDYEKYPHSEPKRHGQYNYDSPAVRSHGKRGRR